MAPSNKDLPQRITPTRLEGLLLLVELEPKLRLSVSHTLSLRQFGGSAQYSHAIVQISSCVLIRARRDHVGHRMHDLHIVEHLGHTEEWDRVSLLIA